MLFALAQAPTLVDESSFSAFVERLARLSIGTIVLACLVCTLMRASYSIYLSREDRRNYSPVLYWGPAIGLAALSVYWGLTQHWVCLFLLAAPLYFVIATQKGNNVGAAKIMHELLDAVVYAGIVVFLLIRPYGVQTFRIPSESMVPGLQVGDLVIVDKFSYRFRIEPQFQDKIVFKPPRRALDMAGLIDPNTDYVKRCVGLPGDTIEIRDGRLYRNGKVTGEPYVRKEKNEDGQLSIPMTGNFKLVKYKGELIPILQMALGGTNSHSAPEYRISPEDEAFVWSLPAEKIPPGYFLMMGDNRHESADSRFWGLVSRDRLVGRVWFTMFSPTAIGISKRTEG